jgi:hypothetical protein
MTTMTEAAPEHVYRWAVPNCGGYIDYSDLPIVSGNAVKYTRRDIADARIDNLYQIWVYRDLTQADFDKAFKD